MEFVWVSMRRTLGYQGEYYGPGSAVRVPVGLQEACNLLIVDAPADDKKAKAKGDTK